MDYMSDGSWVFDGLGCDDMTVFYDELLVSNTLSCEPGDDLSLFGEFPELPPDFEFPEKFLKCSNVRYFLDVLE